MVRRQDADSCPFEGRASLSQSKSEEFSSAPLHTHRGISKVNQTLRSPQRQGRDQVAVWTRGRVDDNDNDNDTLRAGQPTTVSGLAGLSEWVKTPAKKTSVRADVTCTFGKVCNCDTGRRQCAVTEIRKEMEKHTGLCCGTDGRRLEVVVDGLPLFRGAQAVDTALLRRESAEDGAVLALARRKKGAHTPGACGPWCHHEARIHWCSGGEVVARNARFPEPTRQSKVTWPEFCVCSESCSWTPVSHEVERDFGYAGLSSWVHVKAKCEAPFAVSSMAQKKTNARTLVPVIGIETGWRKRVPVVCHLLYMMYHARSITKRHSIAAKQKNTWLVVCEMPCAMQVRSCRLYRCAIDDILMLSPLGADMYSILLVLLLQLVTFLHPPLDSSHALSRFDPQTVTFQEASIHVRRKSHNLKAKPTKTSHNAQLTSAEPAHVASFSGIRRNHQLPPEVTPHLK